MVAILGKGLRTLWNTVIGKTIASAGRGTGHASVGDVLIQGGSPGHAMLIVDMVENKEGQETVHTGQAYMPAQDIHIVINPTD